jgi:hypothetical protein
MDDAGHSDWVNRAIGDEAGIPKRCTIARQTGIEHDDVVTFAAQGERAGDSNYSGADHHNALRSCRRVSSDHVVDGCG